MSGSCFAAYQNARIMSKQPPSSEHPRLQLQLSQQLLPPSVPSTSGGGPVRSGRKSAPRSRTRTPTSSKASSKATTHKATYFSTGSSSLTNYEALGDLEMEMFVQHRFLNLLINEDSENYSGWLEDAKIKATELILIRWGPYLESGRSSMSTTLLMRQAAAMASAAWRKTPTLSRAVRLTVVG